MSNSELNFSELEKRKKGYKQKDKHELLSQSSEDSDQEKTPSNWIQSDSESNSYKILL